MKKLKNIETIIKYLEGEMSEPEMEELEIKALTDPAFQQDIELTKTLIKGIKESGKETTLEEKIQKLKDNPVDQIEEEQEDPENEARVVRIQRYRKKILYPMAVVASVVVLVLAGQMVFFSVPSTPEGIFAKYFEASPNHVTDDFRSDDPQEYVSEAAYNAYDQEDFDQAATLFEQSVPLSDRKHVDRFYLGNCYLVLGEWDAAIEQFKTVVNDQKSFSEDAGWYLALVYVRTGENQKAKPLLENIEVPKNRVRKAQRILRKLH